jgi:glycosyltransferase involved in cell wall biosynthesis
MRILQIGPVPPEIGGLTRGGVANHLWGLATHLAKRGHDVAILTDNYRTANQYPEIKENVEIYGVPNLFHIIQTNIFLKANFWGKVVSTKNQFGPLKSFLRIAVWLSLYHRVIEMLKPDIIHVHHLETRFPFTFFATENKIPIVTTIHSTHSIEFSNDQLSRRLQHLFIQRNLNLSRNLIFVSQFIKQSFEKLFPNGLNEKRTWVIYNPVERSLFYLLSKRKAREFIDASLDKPLILFVGNLIPRKGAHILLDALNELKVRGLEIHLKIVGDGPQKDELASLIQEKELSLLVSLDGSMTQKELLYYYNAADLFVLPSLMESFGIVFIEAMLCGCPVIGSSMVLDELLPSDNYGCFVPPNDAKALASAIEKAIQKSWNREQVREYALNFDWKKKIPDFEHMYREIIGKIT